MVQLSDLYEILNSSLIVDINQSPKEKNMTFELIIIKIKIKQQHNFYDIF